MYCPLTQRQHSLRALGHSHGVPQANPENGGPLWQFDLTCVGKLSGKTEWENPRGKTEWENPVGKPSGKTEWENPVGKSSGEIQWENPVGNTVGKPHIKGLPRRGIETTTIRVEA